MWEVRIPHTFLSLAISGQLSAQAVGAASQSTARVLLGRPLLLPLLSYTQAQTPAMLFVSNPRHVAGDSFPMAVVLLLSAASAGVLLFVLGLLVYAGVQSARKRAAEQRSQQVNALHACEKEWGPCGRGSERPSLHSQ